LQRSSAKSRWNLDRISANDLATEFKAAPAPSATALSCVLERWSTPRLGIDRSSTKVFNMRVPFGKVRKLFSSTFLGLDSTLLAFLSIYITFQKWYNEVVPNVVLGLESSVGMVWR